MHELTIAEVRQVAKQNGKRMVFNKQMHGYQIISGFNSSNIQTAGTDHLGKPWLNQNQLRKLLSYI